MEKKMTPNERRELTIICRMTNLNFEDLESARAYIHENQLTDIIEMIDESQFPDEPEDYEEDSADRKLYEGHNFTSRSLVLCKANLGQKIRYFRQLAELTQKELAEKCDLNESTIRNYELGNRFPDYDTLLNISEALEVNIYTLMNEQDANTPQSALKFLFDLEKYYLLTPKEIDGRMYLAFDCKPDNPMDSMPAFMEQLLRVWSRFYGLFKTGEIDEETYLLWQNKYPTYATANPDDMFGTKSLLNVAIDKTIAAAKKKFRKKKTDK